MFVKKSLIVMLTLALTFSLVLQVAAEEDEYSDLDLGDITGTEILIDGVWYSRPGLDTFPEAQTTGPFLVQTNLAPGSAIDEIWLFHGYPGGSGNFTSLVMTPSGNTWQGEIPAVPPDNYCRLQWQYAFYLQGYDQVGDNIENDERHYVDLSGGDPYVFSMLNPNPNQPPSADAGGPYEVDRWNPITLNGSGFDQEGGALNLEWDVYADWQDFEDSPYAFDDEFDDGVGENPTFDFEESGLYHVRLRVIDECGEEAIAETELAVYDSHLIAIPQDEMIVGLNWREGVEVTLTIDGEVKGTQTTHWISQKDLYGVEFHLGDEGFDLQPGMHATLSGGGVTADHIVRNHTIQMVDIASDQVSGTADPGTYVRVRVQEPFWTEIVAYANGAGEYLADFSTSDPPADITMSTQLYVIQQDDTDSDHTALFWRWPRLEARLSENAVEGYGWPEGETVHLVIDSDSDPANGFLYEDFAPAGYPEWGGSETWVRFELWEAHTLQPGEVVSLSSGGITKVHQVIDLQVTEINIDLDTLTGTSNQEGPLQIWVHPGDNPDSFVETKVENGTWFVDYGGLVDLTPGMAGPVVQFDEDDDATWVEWFIPMPRFEASLVYDWVGMMEFSPDADIELAIYDSPGGNLLFGPALYHTDSEGGAWVEIFEHNLDLVPGMFISVYDPTTDSSKTLVLEDLSLEFFDPASDVFGGTAPPERWMWVDVGNEFGGYGKEISSDPSGEWFAGFSGEFDIQPDMWPRGLLPDEDGDATVAELPSPEFIAGGILPNPVEINTPTEFSATFRSFYFDGPGNPVILLQACYLGPACEDEANWFDMATASADPNVSGSFTYTPTETGVYPVLVRAWHPYHEPVLAFLGYLVVYDPAGGFVTGGGWIWSPAGAYALDPTLEGKANFGFVAKYKKGANVPDGQTEFHFKAGGLNFHSTSYEWLVVAGKKAMFKGVGTINGEGEYKFLISAIDGDLKGGDGIDRFRIKIWYEDENGNEVVVYDNMMNSWIDDDPVTALGGGSIVIHKAK